MISSPTPASVRTRFAPSPTGYLHLGHVYAAKFARDLAEKLGGTYLLRFEDIDTTRVRDHYYDAIIEDLEWLGIQHSKATLRQIDRLHEYDQALEQLKQMGVVYPCFCSRKDIQRELANMISAPHDTQNPSHHYPLICRNLSNEQIAEKLSQGIIPSWRINAAMAREITGELFFEDLTHGKIHVQQDLLGDTILARKDIGTSYHIAVVVDDAFQEISHVTRGSDLLEATHLHRTLQKLLDLPCPIYQHHRLIKNEAGERLAKRAFSATIRDLRSEGLSVADIMEMISD